MKIDRFCRVENSAEKLIEETEMRGLRIEEATKRGLIRAQAKQDRETIRNGRYSNVSGVQTNLFKIKEKAKRSRTYA